MQRQQPGKGVEGRASKQLSLIGTQSTLRGEIGGENILCQCHSHLGDLVILILGPTWEVDFPWVISFLWISLLSSVTYAGWTRSISFQTQNWWNSSCKFMFWIVCGIYLTICACTSSPLKDDVGFHSSRQMYLRK